MLWIGLTGGIASGKSTVSKLLRAEGFDVVDADVLAREVVRSGTDAHREIATAFGSEAISADGELNHKKIGEVVFSDRSKLAVLESIIHPRIRTLAGVRRSELAAQNKSIAFYDVPLLFEKNMETMFDAVVVVSCSRELQLERLVKRDGLSRDEAERRLAAQLPLAQKAARASFVIHNELGLKELEAEVALCVSRLRALAHQAQT